MPNSSTNAVPRSIPRRCRVTITGSNKYAMKRAPTNGTSRIWIARNARNRATISPAKARSRTGPSPNRFFIRPPDLPDVAQLSVCKPKAFGKRFRQPQTDLRAHARMQVDDFHKIGMEESDQLRTLACNSCRRSGRVTEKGHLSKKITRFKFGKNHTIFSSVLKDDVHSSGTDYIHARAGFCFYKDRLTGLISTDM